MIVPSLGVLGLVGIALSVFVAQREMRQFEALERLRLEQSVAAHFGALDEHLMFRESLARTVATLFMPPPLSTPHPLGNFAARVQSMIGDVTTLGWLPQVGPDQAFEALKALAAMGIKDPHFIGARNRRIDPLSLDRPMFPILDAVPQDNRLVLGVDAGDFPDRRAAIERARDLHTIRRTAPLRLLRYPNDVSLLLYAPVFGGDGRFRGVLGFGYEVGRLLYDAIDTSKATRDFDVYIYAADAQVPLIGVAADGTRISAPLARTDISNAVDRTTEFGGPGLHVLYVFHHDIAVESLRRGIWIALGGVGLTAAVVLMLGFAANRASNLAREVVSRSLAEERLKGLIHELNHRVRNIMAVAQSIVRLSFPPGAELAEIKLVCEGRLQALSSAMSLLTDSDWKGVSIRSLATASNLPFSGRIIPQGPELALKPKAAQTFGLLLYELAVNAAKHGALSVPEGKVHLDWSIIDGPTPVFRMIWREAGGPVVARPTRRGFGELLIRRIAPHDVAGRGTITYDPEGFRYELEAPLHEISAE